MNAIVVGYSILAAWSLISLVILAIGFHYAYQQRRVELFKWNGQPVHVDEFFGLTGVLGCAIATAAHIAIWFVI